MAGVGVTAFLVWEGLHGWCGKSCVAGVGRGFIVSAGRAAWLGWVEASSKVLVELYGMTGTMNYMTCCDVVEICHQKFMILSTLDKTVVFCFIIISHLSVQH